jgi:hypothetical protein
VFDHHVGQRETSLARHRLLQQVPALRDRELVTTHRYERAFTAYLRDTLPPDRSMTTISIAFAAAVVAVHNAILRRWLRNPHLDLRPELEEAFADLRRVAAAPLPGRSNGAAGASAAGTGATSSESGASSEGGTSSEGAVSEGAVSEGAVSERLVAPEGRGTARIMGTGDRRVVVAVLDPGAGPDDVARAVRDALA